MRSFILIEVEHGDTTDPLDVLIDNLFVGQPMQFGDNEYKITDFSVAVDLPPYVTSVNAPTLILRTS